MHEKLNFFTFTGLETSEYISLTSIKYMSEWRLKLEMYSRTHKYDSTVFNI